MKLGRDDSTRKMSGTSEEHVEPLKTSREEVMQCSFPSWYSHFEKVTPLSFIIDLPEDFVAYLLSDDTLRLPGKLYEWKKEQNSDSSSGSDAWSDTEDDESTATEVPKFDELSRKVMKKIRKLGGRCFPKLDWSSPKDAAWIALNHSLSCSTFVDICLLLKSSQFTTHDLMSPFEFCHIEGNPGSNTPLKYHLIVRKWVEIEPSFEFRCFVRDKQLIGISQRETSQVYSYIFEQQEQIVNDIVSFYNEYIVNKFPLTNYTFDVFRSKKDYVRLLDFNAFCSQTDGLLFDWKELQTLAISPNPELRFHRDDTGIRPNNYRNYSLPADVLHFANATGPEQLIDLLRIQKVQKDGVSESSSEEEGEVQTTS